MAKLGGNVPANVREAYTAHVLPSLARTPPSRSPRVLVVNGTQGMRKTTMSRWVAAHLGMTAPYVLEGDDLFEALPGYRAFARAHGGVAAQTRYLDDYLDLRKLTTASLRARGVDVALVGVFAEPGFLRSEVRPFRADGYRTDLATSTVSRAFAYAHMVVRHGEQVQSGEVPLPLGEVAAQDGLQKGVLGVMHTMEEDPGRLFGGMHLFTERSTVLSQRRGDDGRWNRTFPGTMAQHAERERNGPWTLPDALEQRRQSDRGRETVLQNSDEIPVARELLRASRKDANTRPIDPKGTAFRAALAAIDRAMVPLSRQVRRTEPGSTGPGRDGSGSTGPGRAPDHDLSPPVPATFRAGRQPRMSERAGPDRGRG